MDIHAVADIHGASHRICVAVGRHTYVGYPAQRSQYLDFTGPLHDIPVRAARHGPDALGRGAGPDAHLIALYRRTQVVDLFPSGDAGPVLPRQTKK